MTWLDGQPASKEIPSDAHTFSRRGRAAQPLTTTVSQLYALTTGCKTLGYLEACDLAWFAGAGFRRDKMPDASRPYQMLLTLLW
ncbi:MAG: hypothetical protein ACOH2R_23450 [Pseudomonas sp.]